MRALLVCGSLNQTRMMHKIAEHLPMLECAYTPYFCDGWMRIMQRSGAANFTVLGGRFRQQTLAYLHGHGLTVDDEGSNGPYDLVVTCSDLIVPKLLRRSKLVLVQEGMTDPETWAYHLVNALRLPRWIAHTSTTGLSHAYDLFCVASTGYRDLFIRKGVRPEKIQVTGIPNFDDCKAAIHNDFPFRDYLLVATSDRRETYKYEDRRKFIQRAQRLADGRQLIFKFHPNEDALRAEREVRRHAPDALTFAHGDTDHMIANCQALLTRYSSVIYVALALDKETYCDVPIEQLRRLLPIQNGGRSAANIAEQCLRLLGLGSLSRAALATAEAQV
jgi:hypothetical protein